MSVIHSLIVLLSLSSVLTSAQIVNPYCDVSDYITMDDDPKLPQLPDQFYYSMEAVLVERNSTIFAQEYFDEIGNRGRIDFTSSRGKSSAISDYNLGEAFLFPNQRTGQECTVNDLTNNMTFSRLTQFFFGIVYGENNTVHIGAPSFMLYSTINTSNVNYIGVNTTRGIPSYHWQTCVVNENNSYTLDYYFTDDNLWTNSYGVQGYIPVTVELKGVRWDSMENKIINVEHYYMFVDYNTGNTSVPNDVFLVPQGLICAGRFPGKPIPSFPDYFSTGLEIFANNTVSTFEEYYDLSHGLFRVDGYTVVPNYYTGTFTTIQDFNSEAQYFFTYNHSSLCTTSPLLYEYAAFDSDVDDNGHLHLKALKSLFYIEDYRGFVYEGVSNYSGVIVDVWIAQNLTNITISNKTYNNSRYEIYVTQPGNRLNSKYGTTTEPTIWSTFYSGTVTTLYSNGSTSSADVSSTTNFFSFSRTEPPIDVFDISDCLTRDQYTELKMSIKMNVQNISKVNLNQNIRAAITDYVNRIGMPFLSPLQVSSIRIGQSNDQYTYIHLHIANVSDNAIQKWSYSANAVVSRILQNINNGDKLPFTINIGDIKVSPYYHSEDDESEESVGLSKGAVTGISIGTFLIGIIVGCIVGILIHMFFSTCIKKRGSVEFQNSSGNEKYQRQINDIPIADDD